MKRASLDDSIGYSLRRAQVAFRSAIDRELAPFELSTPQYGCLEQLAQRPDRSNAELARGTFVSRQAMHQLLGGLVAAGLVTATGRGRDARYRCTAAGVRRLAGASHAVAVVEERMLAPLGPRDRERLLAALRQCVAALDEPAATG